MAGEFAQLVSPHVQLGATVAARAGAYLMLLKAREALRRERLAAARE